jgi:excisionase family DNA binding protein
MSDNKTTGGGMADKHPEAMADTGIMTVRDVARYLRMSEAKVYRMVNNGQIPSFRLGKSWRFKRELVDNWILKETELIFHA